MRNKIGINVDARRIDGNLETLKHDLETIEQLGFDVAEIPVNGVDAIANGVLKKDRVEQVKEVMKQFKLEYTVHAPNALNLQDLRYPETQRRVFKSCIEFTAAIGAEKLVYHQGKLIRGGNSEGEVAPEEAYEMEVEGLIDLAHLAEECGVMICVENVYSSITHLVRLVRDVGMSNVGICYDFGHSFINSRRIGYDFFRSIQLAKPYIYHTHVQDNFGKGELEELGSKIPYIEGMTMGIGDLHLPPGWGSIPYEKVFRLMEGYTGVYLIELHQRFFFKFEDNYMVMKEALENTRKLLARAETLVH